MFIWIKWILIQIDKKIENEQRFIFLNENLKPSDKTMMLSYDVIRYIHKLYISTLLFQSYYIVDMISIFVYHTSIIGMHMFCQLDIV